MTDLNVATRARLYARDKVRRFADVVIVPLLPSRAANLLQSRLADWKPYFKEAEGEFEGQWKEIIWPLIKDFDFGTVLELSPGAGRNTERLTTLTSRLIAVDYRQNALNQTRARLGTLRSGC
ncbi:MAG: methylase involved in ubiquinone/menaquinone biosynthesis, partial [Mycobacterium sp.]|nr:methylase involved in ubiquinone/menaquinone biosynthesis [Mycobacterium sp.]